MSTVSYELAQKVYGSSGGGHIFLEECQVCGLLRWSCTRTADPNAVTVEPLNDRCGEYPCERCIAVVRRAPEVYEWVCAVVAHHQPEGAPDGEAA